MDPIYLCGLGGRVGKDGTCKPIKTNLPRTSPLTVPKTGK